MATSSPPLPEFKGIRYIFEGEEEEDGEDGEKQPKGRVN